ncbi:MAG: hypothetical protein WDZ93_01540 [Candidatus Paceibacterota bacterium]
MDTQILNQLIEQLYTSEEGGLYRTFWGKRPEDFSTLPLLTPDILASTSLYDRTYSRDQGLVRSVATRGSEFLVKRSFVDIAHEHLPVPSGSRALVLTTNPDDALEYALWCYEHGSIPYYGDVGNVEVAVFCAEHFRTNVLITDNVTIASLITDARIPSMIELVVIIDRVHSSDQTPLLATERVLYLPETGCLGRIESTTDGLVLLEDGRVFAEVLDDTLVVTKANATTPLIRYKTEIAARVERDTIYLV